MDLPSVEGVGLLAGLVTRAAFDNVEALAESYGDRLPIDLVRRLAETAGFPATVELTVTAEDTGETLVRAFKRVTLTTRPERGTNPPPPRFQIGDAWVGPVADGTPFLCAPEEAALEPLDAGSETVLSPAEDDDAWREQYPILTIDGAIATVTEGAYYSWYATAGDLRQGKTSAPAREEIWTAPSEGGQEALWLVVRDGHGGTSACRIDVDVEAR
jgi:hypothetical protein